MFYSLPTQRMEEVSILIINEIVDHKNASKNHFSLTKGECVAYYTAQIKNTNVYFLTLGNEETINGITYKKDLTLEFMQQLNIVLFIRETNIHTVLQRYPFVKQHLDNQYKKPIKDTKVGIKGDSLAWLNNKDLKNFVKEAYNLELLEWGYKFFSVIYVQIPASIKPAMKLLKSDHLSKLHTSKMGVPNETFKISEIENKLDKTVYIDNIVHKQNAAFLPFKLLPSFRAHAIMDPPATLKEPYKIIYTGRIKTDGGRIMFMMSDIMKKLGNDYHLHIFPGKFVVPGVEVKDYSPKNMVHLQFLRDHIFHKNENVFVHYPYDHNDRLCYLVYADVGLDFSPTRPSDNQCPYGNSKLLDYCYAGIPVVTESNVGNIHLVQEAKNGIILRDKASVDDYVKALKIACKLKINREKVSEITIKNNNWYDICKNILRDFSNV